MFRAQTALRRSLVAGLSLAIAASLGVGYAANGKSAESAAAPKAASQSSPSQQVIELINQGSGQLNSKDFAAAEASFQKAIQADPNFAPAHRGLGIAYWHQGQLGAAWKQLNEVATLEPKSARAHYDLGQLAWSLYSSPSGEAATGLSRDDFKALALSEMANAVALKPHDFRMRLDLSELELDVGQKEQAKADALGAFQLAISASQRSRAELAVARASMATGDEMRAESEFKKAITENPANGAAYVGLGQICLVQQDTAQAAENFRKAIQVSPDLASGYSALAKLLAKNGQPVQAAALLKKAVALNPQDWQSQYQLAKLMMQAGDSAGAKALFKKIIAHQPDFLPAAQQLALMHLRQGDVQGAITEAEALVGRNPQAAEGHEVLALALWRERKTEDSLAECAQALAADPNSTPMLALQSLELWETRRKRDARSVLREIARRNPAILSSVTFCRLIVCGSEDISVVSRFLHDNQYILSPPPGMGEP